MTKDTFNMEKFLGTKWKIVGTSSPLPYSMSCRVTEGGLMEGVGKGDM